MLSRLKFKLILWLWGSAATVSVVEGDAIWFVDEQRIDVRQMIAKGVPGIIIDVKNVSGKSITDCVACFSVKPKEV